MPEDSLHLPDGVSTTALGVAWIRAAESRRADRLFDDPLAARFVAAAGWEPVDLPDRPPEDPAVRGLLVMAQSVIVRTRFLDDLVMGAWAAGARQVVILGAGLDTRAFRLPWPDGGHCFELDLPPVLDFKEKALAGSGAEPRCRRTVLAADLLGDWPSALLDAGFERAIPTVWLAEGLFIYFSQAENDRIMAEIGALSTLGDRLGLTYSRGTGTAPAPPPSAPPPPGLELLADPGAVIALWRWDPPDDLTAWLAGHGWAAETYDREERAAAYDRRVPWAEDADAATRTVLIDAHRL
ncbi:MAG TPA: SAM-dependent methyltransferase [Acidimicrobiia bacterium]|nr:SAM-dependent methyltransferase [Acidimicrobiia bacterium]